MERNKDIRFADKKVDDSWKDQAEKEKGKLGSSLASRSAEPSSEQAKKSSSSSPHFINLLNWITYQALFNLGEIPGPDGDLAPANPEAAREMIEYLAILKEKTHGNQGPEEQQFFAQALPELQMKYSQLS